jgi:hypothetical protein
MASASERKRGNRPEAAVQSAVRERAPAPRERVRTPTQPRPAPRKLPWLWIGAAIAVPVVATLVVLIARMVSSHGPAHAPPPSAAPPAVAALASTPPVVVAAPVPPPAPTPAPAVVVPPPAVVAPVVAAATPPSTESRVGLADLANAPLVRPPDAPHHYHAHHAASAAGGTGSQPCMCVATVQNATVVAQGGTLAHEVALCTATDAAGQGRGEFLGTGAIPTTVLGAQAELSCRQGDRSLQLVVQRYALAGGTGSLFRCRARTAPADGEAAAPPNAGAAHRPSSGGDANP